MVAKLRRFTPETSCVRLRKYQLKVVFRSSINTRYDSSLEQKQRVTTEKVELSINDILNSSKIRKTLHITKLKGTNPEVTRNFLKLMHKDFVKV